ncbi:MAG: hypothetical protein KC468_20890, partial [Myxococcales bacterium]|nr:hypothetical protein [Myxococcales bacterium]
MPLTAWICAATLVACGPEPEPQAGSDALSAFGVELVDGGSRVAGLSWGGPGDADCRWVYRVSVDGEAPEQLSRVTRRPPE